MLYINRISCFQLQELFDIFMDKVLNFKRLNCIEPVPTNELNLIQSFCRLMDVLATQKSGIEGTNPEVLEPIAKMWFMFCLIWSICSTVDENGRMKIDGFIREIDGMFPLKDTIYDYCVDVKRRSLVGWSDKLSDEWRFPNE